MADDTEGKYARLEGRARTGIVGLRSFDEGVVKTMGAVEGAEGSIDEGRYIIAVPGMNYAPGSGGVPVTFFYPEDVNSKFRIPAIVVTRDDLSPSMNRWHPGSLQYRVPGVGANQIRVGNKTGHTKNEELQQAVPFDITYSLMLYARTRGQGNVLLDYILRIYPPYCNVKVMDSVGDYRYYSAFMESLGMIDDVQEVGDRVIAFAVTLRVEAELDLNDPVTQAAVTQRPTVKTRGI